MANNAELREETFDRIIKLSTIFVQEEIASALNVSKASVSRVISIDKLAKEGDVASILSYRDYSAALREWAAKRHGLDLTPKPTPAPVATAKPAEAQQAADDKNIAELIAAVSRINGNLVNLSAQIEAMSNALREVINANADIIYGEIASHKDILNGIKANTRRRYEGVKE